MPICMLLLLCMKRTKKKPKKHIAKALEYDPNNEDAKKLSKSINQ